MLDWFIYSGLALLVPVTVIVLYLIVDSIFGSPDESPKLYCRSDNKIMKYVLQKCPRMQKPFRPAWWMRNSHVQTIVGSMMSVSDVSFNREYVKMADGGQVALDWVSCDMDAAAPVLLVIPGLSGDAKGMSSLCKLAVSRGYRPFVFNKRGHGDSVITTPKLQSFGDPTDLRAVIVFVSKKYPKSKLVGAGWSAGSALLAAYVGEYHDPILVSGVAVSPGYDLKYLFENCVKQPYNYILMRNLKSILQKNASVLSRVIDVDRALKSRNLAEYEENLYCRLYGYKTMDDYYSKNNPVRNTYNGAIPFLCISSLDDPVCRKDCIVYRLFKDSEIFSLLTVDRGGHCGFLEGSKLERWADKITLDYLSAVLDYQSENKF